MPVTTKPHRRESKSMFASSWRRPRASSIGSRLPERHVSVSAVTVKAYPAASTRQMALDLEQLDPVMGVALYAVANIVITSVCPIPLGVFMIVAAALLWGAMLGGVLSVSYTHLTLPTILLV